MFDPGSTGFMILGAMLVFLMTPALAFFYGGLSRRKNVLNTMFMSIAVIGFVGVLWIVAGWSFAYGGDGSLPFFGGLDQIGCLSAVNDMVAEAESRELAEKGFLTSSCCPAFVTYIRQSFPQLLPMVSHNLSPMAAIARFIKETTPDAKTIFIGPCTAKKAEGQLPEVKEYVDCVLTFEELQALFDSRDIDPTTLEETELNNASYYGRIFGHCGGLSMAAAEALKEQGIEFDAKPISCSGIEECRMALLKAKVGKLDANFIEGMACIGGCVNGAGSLTHSAKNQQLVEKHGKEAERKTIQDSVSHPDVSFKH